MAETLHAKAISFFYQQYPSMYFNAEKLYTANIINPQQTPLNQYTTSLPSFPPSPIPLQNIPLTDNQALIYL